MSEADDYLKKYIYHIDGEAVVNPVYAFNAIALEKKYIQVLTKFYKSQAESYKADWERWNDEKDKMIEKAIKRGYIQAQDDYDIVTEDDPAFKELNKIFDKKEVKKND